MAGLSAVVVGLTLHVGTEIGSGLSTSASSSPFEQGGLFAFHQSTEGSQMSTTFITFETYDTAITFKSLRKIGDVTWAVLYIKSNNVHITHTLWYPTEELIAQLIAAFGPPEQTDAPTLPGTGPKLDEAPSPPPVLR